ncbi:MAG: class I SAM-dependent methyltransferase [Aeromicrobium sp.]
MNGDQRFVPAAGFKSLTRFYDLGILLTMREGQWRPLLAERATQDDPATIVDVGCGTGTLTIAIAAQTPAKVVGIDGDPAILELARRKQGAERVEWRQGLADSLPFADDSVDCVVSTLVMHHLPRDTKVASLDEMARILRPGGTLLIADWGKPHGPVTRAAFFGLQLLDGFATTADNVNGMLPGFIVEAGFVGLQRIERIRTVAGSFEILQASTPV